MGKPEKLRPYCPRKSLVHGIANCSDCSWECQDYMTVQRKAASHARTEEHNVSVELGYAVMYEGRRPR